MCLYWLPTSDQPAIVCGGQDIQHQHGARTEKALFLRPLRDYTSSSNNRKLSAVTAGFVWQIDSYRDSEKLLNIENKN